MNNTTRLFVQSVVVPQYWDAPNGRGHKHLEDVLAAAAALVGRDLSDREFLTIALHDIGVGRLGFTRDEHPRASIFAIEMDAALEPIRSVVDAEMRDAILYHMRDEYRVCGLLSPLHQLLVEADEGSPVWGPSRITKPVKYWLDGRNEKMPPDSPLEVVIPHILKVLRKKVVAFNSGEPPFTERYCRVFAREIEQATTWVSGVGEHDVVDCINAIRTSPHK